MLLAVDIAAPASTGAIQGSVYGLLGLGLVLLYKSNRVFNFAQAEFGTSAAFATFFAVNGTGLLPQMPIGLALAFGVLVGTGIGLLTERLVVRPLCNAPKVTLAVATAGVALLLIAVQGFLAGAEPGSFPPIVAGVLPVWSGEIRFDGKKVSGKGAPGMVGAGISLSPEGRGVWPGLSVLKNLELGAWTVKDKAQIARSVQAVFGHFPRLDEGKDQLAGTLSGGAQQMLAIGRPS